MRLRDVDRERVSSLVVLATVRTDMSQAEMGLSVILDVLLRLGSLPALQALPTLWSDPYHRLQTLLQTFQNKPQQNSLNSAVIATIIRTQNNRDLSLLSVFSTVQSVSPSSDHFFRIHLLHGKFSPFPNFSGDFTAPPLPLPLPRPLPLALPLLVLASLPLSWPGSCPLSGAWCPIHPIWLYVQTASWRARGARFLNLLPQPFLQLRYPSAAGPTLPGDPTTEYRDIRSRLQSIYLLG